MATKDISDLQVVQAYRDWRAMLDVAIKTGSWGQNPHTAPELLMQRTGQPLKVCWSACERADRRGLVDWGVNLGKGWLTDKGKAMIKEAEEKWWESPDGQKYDALAREAFRKSYDEVNAKYCDGKDIATDAKEMLDDLQAKGLAPATSMPSRRELDQILRGVIAENPTQYASLKDRPQNAQWFVGQVLVRTQGRANPKLVEELLHSLSGEHHGTPLERRDHERTANLGGEVD